MKKIHRTYQVVCKSCNGMGRIENYDFDPNVTGSEMYMICPACNGSKLITVNETITESEK